MSKAYEKKKMEECYWRTSETLSEFSWEQTKKARKAKVSTHLLHWKKSKTLLKNRCACTNPNIIKLMAGPRT